MIDLHHHCLAGVDDGPAALGDAVAQCRMAFEDGIRTIIATPHRRHPQYDVPPGAAREAHGRLAAVLAAEGVGIDLQLGHEVHWSDGLVEGLKSGELLRLAGNRRWFLFELPDTHVPVNLEQLIFDLHLAGQFPILAHPERNHELAKDDERLAKLRGQGMPVQVTAMSVTGEFGRQPRRAAERWLKAGLVDFIATDAHDCGRRPAHLRKAVDLAARLAGREAAERMVGGNPARVLRGEPLS